MDSLYALFGIDPEEAKKIQVFAKGHPIAGRNPSEWCRDDFGNELHYSAHGDRLSPYGWEMDHIVLKMLGGSDDVSNLRPLHCRLNALQGGLASGLGALFGKG